MTEQDEFAVTAADQALDEQLRSLQRFAPRQGFADRVMARVYRPDPLVVRARRFRVDLLSPRRLWWAAGLAAASSAAGIVGVGNWIAVNGIATVGAFLNAQLLVPAGAALLQMNALVTKMATEYALSAYGALGDGVYGLAAAAMFLPILCSGGLYLTMKQPSGKRIATYAAR